VSCWAGTSSSSCWPWLRPVSRIRPPTSRPSGLASHVRLRISSTPIAKGVADTSVIGPEIARRQREILALDRQLSEPRKQQMAAEDLRAALEQRAETWRETLRAEVEVARVLIRRLIGPILLFEEAPDYLTYEVEAKPAILEGLASIQDVASPAGFEPALPA
jgi:hypothetical protein